MTPEQKAYELLWEYLPILESWEETNSNKAKKCALIAADLAIEVESIIFKGNVYKSYWQQVKQAIEKL